MYILPTFIVFDYMLNRYRTDFMSIKSNMISNGTIVYEQVKRLHILYCALQLSVLKKRNF